MRSPSETGPSCVIGRGITIKGTVRGAEDVVVEGTLEGRLELQHHLLVETSGKVRAEVSVRTVAVAGALEGHVDAEGIALHAGCVVSAQLKSPRIIIEDGARFTGTIEMDVPLPEDL